MRKFVDVILPLPIPQLFTYEVEQELCGLVQVGCRVIVPFGRKKIYTAIVANIHQEAPQGYDVKPIYSVQDSYPIVHPMQLKFWKWISSYYMSSIGDVYKAAVPSGLKLESETRIELNPDYVGTSDLSDRELKILHCLSEEPSQFLTALSKKTEIENILPYANKLLDRGAIFLKEELVESYKPKIESRIRFKGDYKSPDQLEELFNSLSSAPKQLDLVMKYIELSNFFSPQGLKEVIKSVLITKANASYQSLKGLVQKDIFEEYIVEVDRLEVSDDDENDAKSLNEAQFGALQQLLTNYQSKPVSLLYGVTSSGKTEVYIHLISEYLKKGKQVLYLLPEIALTTQITSRLKHVFGDKLGVYHSKFPDNERVEIWKKQVSDSPYQIILGVRSSILLPFQNLGLIIVDEEHESSYKQQDPAPRYHARDAAIVLANMFKAHVLLGTATPSIESWYNAQSGKYGFVQLKERYKEIKLPQILPVDIKELKRKKRMSGQFSPLLLDLIKETLGNNEQVILFQNRRGFAPIIECNSCGWVPKCINCDVSLTYHKRANELTCHYCGHTQQIPSKCPLCDGVELQYKGFGTEKVEEEIKKLFPEAKVGRMDLDTTRTRSSYEKIIADFQEGRTNILIGTQMISKGLDFNDVSVVGILNADTMLNYPDFRSYERAYQLMAQVSGRAGRHGKQGRVVLQTYSVDHPVIDQIKDNQYEEMVNFQLEEREMFHYPPFYRLIYVYLKHKDERALNQATTYMADRLRAVFNNRVLGPDKPPVGRIQLLYIKKIVLKIERNASMKQVKDLLWQVKEEMIQNTNFKSLIVYYDVDPM